MKHLSRADFIGIVNSSLCMAHCLAMPILIGLGAAFLHHPLVSLGFIAIAGIAVHATVRRGAGTGLSRFLWTAWALFAVTLLLEEVHHAFLMVSLLASALLVVGHGLHWRAMATVASTR